VHNYCIALTTVLLFEVGLQEAAQIAYAQPNNRQSTNPDTADMVLIPGGSFTMGSLDGDADELPLHRVWVDSFYLDKYEVTNEQFLKFVTATGYETLSERTGEGMSWRVHFTPERLKYPVVYVAWEDASAYAKWAGKRLPTEAEWEYAARGGLEGKTYPWGNEWRRDACNHWHLGEDSLLARRIDFNQGRGTLPVGSFAPNGFGVYDVLGNVWEFCSDWYDSIYYRISSVRNPQGPAKGEFRVVRGGSWYSCHDCGNALRCADRAYVRLIDRNIYVGFRCAKDFR
jgi:formylglycine-generating enzyme required for sulfatase activity